MNFEKYESADFKNPCHGEKYNQIGHGYARYRQEDPLIKKIIEKALEGAKTVVNVGAGAGSYEPLDKNVIAVEPSAIMAAQRSPQHSIALKATADRLPLHDKSVDAAMTVLSLHHWGEAQLQAQGVQEMLRVAQKKVVIVTIDSSVSGEMWLMRDYLREVAELDDQLFPPMERLIQWLGDEVSIKTIPISRNSPDGSLLSFWAHPERVFNPEARNATSGFASQTEAVISRVVAKLREDLESGAWEQKNGRLRDLESYDAGLRILVKNEPY